MKKAIIKTILAISCVSAVTAAGVFLSAYSKIDGYTAYEYNYVNAKNSNNLTLNNSYLNGVNTSLKELILGSKKFNNGTYIIYIGSEGYQLNRSFLYGKEQSNIDAFQSNLTPVLNGDFGGGIDYLTSNEFAAETSYPPKVITYIDKLSNQDFIAREEFLNLINEYKNLPIPNTEEGNKFLEGYKGKELKKREKILENNKKKKEWADSKSIETFSFEPGATYEDWKGNTKYFRKSYKSALQFNEICNYVKKNFSNLLDISTSSGIVIGYKNGKIVNSYSGSFTEVNPNEDNSNESETQSSFSSSFLLNKNIAREWNAVNNFVDWIKNNFSDEK